jgi:hypothetical protein
VFRWRFSQIVHPRESLGCQNVHGRFRYRSCADIYKQAAPRREQEGKSVGVRTVREAFRTNNERLAYPGTADQYRSRLRCESADPDGGCSRGRKQQRSDEKDFYQMYIAWELRFTQKNILELPSTERLPRVQAKQQLYSEFFW